MFGLYIAFSLLVNLLCCAGTQHPERNISLGCAIFGFVNSATVIVVLSHLISQ